MDRTEKNKKGEIIWIGFYYRPQIVSRKLRSKYVRRLQIAPRKIGC